MCASSCVLRSSTPVYVAVNFGCAAEPANPSFEWARQETRSSRGHLYRRMQWDTHWLLGNRRGGEQERIGHPRPTPPAEAASHGAYRRPSPARCEQRRGRRELACGTKVAGAPFGAAHAASCWGWPPANGPCLAMSLQRLLNQVGQRLAVQQANQCHLKYLGQAL